MKTNIDLINDENLEKSKMPLHSYRRAECFLPWNLQNTVFNTTIFPYWTHEALYYFQESINSKFLLKIDTETGKKETILDYQKLLDALSIQIKQNTSLSIPMDNFSIQENPLRLCFTYDKETWCYDLKKHMLFQSEKSMANTLTSPDKNWVLWKKDYDLVLTNLISNQDFQLTTDGELYYDYASSPETNTQTVTNHLRNIILAPVGLWSPDSSKLITHKLDQRKVPELSLLQNAPEGSQRPKLYNYRMSFSGDSNVPLVELIIIDAENQAVIPIKTEPFLSPYLTPLEFKWIWWSEDNKNIYFLRETRGSKELELCIVDASTGNTQTLITEMAKTYIEPSQLFPCPPQVIILKDNKGIIWLSERSGYAHLYLYDSKGNDPKNVTQGEWCVREVHFYDDKADWIYFTACGYDNFIDPYYKQLFRCHLNGSELQCLTQENANHTISFSPQNNCFLDTYSAINSIPITLLKKLDGAIVSHVETGDIHGLTDLGWVPPERFCTKARDGLTDIYGNLYFPSNFDPNKTYPIIDHIYPGPQFYRTPIHFSLYGAIFRSAWTAQALAELGFIVIHVDGFGAPGRSKEFHDTTYQNMSDCGIPDHVSAITQLAEKYSYIDLERVGITGYSGGGYAAVRAMLKYPHFYKVGVAAAGNHDLRCYPASYGEKYNGLDSATYADQSNAAYADKLLGSLLLIHGEMDDNVHPCATLQLVDALIKHNKDFDMLIMPNQNHDSTFDHPYYMRRQWDYFVRLLLDQNPPKNYQIKQMPFDFPQLKDW